MVLLLIIFFMMTTQFARSEHEAMNLPAERGEEAPPESGRTVFLDLARDGTLTMLNRPVSLEEAGTAVQAAAAVSDDKASPIRVVVRADRDAPAAAFSAVCRVLSQAGIKTVSLGTNPQDGGGP